MDNQGLLLTVARSPEATTFASGLLKPSCSLAPVAMKNFRGESRTDLETEEESEIMERIYETEREKE